MNILYLAYDGMTDPLGQSQVIPYLIGLTKKGYRFTIISFEKKNEQRQVAKISRLLTAHKIAWQPLPYTKTPPILSTVWNMLNLYATVAKLHKRHSFKIVHCRSIITAIIGLYLKKKYGIKFIFDMRGFWADERVDGKLWNVNNPIYRAIYTFFKDKEKKCLKNADHIISLTHHGKREIVRWRATQQPITVIPCCVDTALFDASTTTNLLRATHKQALRISSDSFVLGYLGGIGTWYMLNEMLDFFKVFLTFKQNAIFLFITPEPEKTILVKAKARGIAEKHIRITKVQRELVPQYLSLFDCSIFFILPAYSKKASSPTKQAELMSMQIPVICNTNVGDTDTIVKKYKSGVLVNAFNDAAYYTAIKSYFNIIFDGNQLRSGAIDYFSLAGGIDKYASIYAQLVA